MGQGRDEVHATFERIMKWALWSWFWAGILQLFGAGGGGGRAVLQGRIFASPQARSQSFWHATANAVSTPYPLQQPRRARKGEIEKILLLSLFLGRWTEWENHQTAYFLFLIVSFLFLLCGMQVEWMPVTVKARSLRQDFNFYSWFCVFLNWRKWKKQTNKPQTVFKLLLKDWSLKTMVRWKPLRLESHCQSKWQY